MYIKHYEKYLYQLSFLQQIKNYYLNMNYLAKVRYREFRKKNRQASLNSRAIWSTEQVSGQPGLHSETLS